MFEELIKHVKTLMEVVNVKFIRMDNSGENVNDILNELKKLGIECELTPPNTPQHNGVVERRFYADHIKEMSMLTCENVQPKIKKFL